MQKLGMHFLGWTLVALALSACSATAPDEAPVTPAPVATTVDLIAQPQRIDFQSTDGTQLVGTYWPATHPSATGIMLMHMMRARKESWQSLPTLLQSQQGYAVFAFDFRGHGESKGSSSDRAGMLEDARAALSTFRALSGVDPERIVLIGASIGADAAVDICGEGCIGAISLSPGSFLGTAYDAALLALGDKPVLCVASEDDSQSAMTCRDNATLGLSDYQTQLYTGGRHGTDMLAIADQQPMLIDLIFDWLTAHFSGD